MWSHLALLAIALGLGIRPACTKEIFTPEDLLSAPRPQPALANPDGSLALAVVDQWDPNTDVMGRSVYLLSLNSTISPSPPISLFNTTSSQASEFIWLSEDTIGYLNGSSIFSLSVNYSTTTTAASGKLILDFPKGVNASNLLYHASSGLLYFSGSVWSDGNFNNTEQWDAKYHGRRDSALVYDELMVRHWDTWRTPGKVQTVGITSLYRHQHEWKVNGGGFVNVLNGTGLSSQIDDISSSSVSISSSHIAIAIKTPHINVATHTREDIYLFPISPNSQRLSVTSPKHLTPHQHGAINSVTFSPDAKKLAWLEQGKDGYESDKRVIVVYNLKKGKMERWTEEWDRSPSSLIWALDSESIYFIAEHHGRMLPYHLTHAGHLPTPLLFNESTTSITQLSSSKLLLSKQSLTSPSDEFILTLSKPEDKDGDGDKLPNKLHQLTRWADSFIGGRLDEQKGEEFWFEGALGKKVAGWAVKPPGWKEGQKKAWPLAFLIHGGPQGAWEDSWSTRWNPALFASQGYFVVAINPTGSTGYGQEFTDAIQGDWGGKPFKDLLAGYHHVLEHYPEIDPERTAALGASYGGYMINWINGHNEQFGFKALVCHDGVFDTVTTYFSTEEVWFPTQDFDGTPLTNRAAYEKWNPVNHAIEWTTPQLVIQGGKDYRLENSQGLGAFTALQTQGVPSRFVYFPDENHWVLKPHNSMRWHYEVLRWLDEWVGKGHGRISEASLAAKSELVLQHPEP